MGQTTLLEQVPLEHAMMLPLFLTAAAIFLGGQVALGFWVRGLAARLASQQQKIEDLENRLPAPLPGASNRRQTAPGENSKEHYKVLYLNSLGYTAAEIARETQLRVAEVDFILRVEAQAAAVKSLA